ncbi:deoxynucleoside kinase [Lysinibacillus capsici]|nr:deoxynucleoside kinase [Lysinibacillus sp. FN11]UYB49813.1 deoxynucleoside kinase [Lysinibacillus capsici]
MLSDITEFKVVKGSSFQHSQCSQDELFEKFLEFTKMDSVIFDRFHICNEIYAPMYDDFAMLSDEQRRFIEQEMKGNAIVIYLYADDEVLENRFNSRGDDYVSLEKLKYAKGKYEEALHKVEHLEVVKFDTGKMTTKEIVEQILLNY